MSLATAFIDGIRGSIRRLAQPGFDDRVQVLPAALGLRAELMGSLTLARTSPCGQGWHDSSQIDVSTAPGKFRHDRAVVELRGQAQSAPADEEMSVP